MRIRGFALPIVVTAAVIALGGIALGLIVGRDHAPLTSAPEASVMPTESPLETNTLSGHREYAGTYAGWLERNLSEKGRAGTGDRGVSTLQQLPEPVQAAEENAANAAGNRVLVNVSSGGIIRKQAQYIVDAGQAIQTEPEGGPSGLPGTSTEGDEDEIKDVEQGQEQALPLPDKPELKYPNLGSRLDNLVASVEEEKTTAENAAASGTAQREGSVTVTVTIYLSGYVEDVARFLEMSGGDPRNVGEDYIEAYIPVSLLGPVSERPGVIRVREIILPEGGRNG